MMWLVNLVSGLFLFFLGLAIRMFKMSYLISGYNTASREEKEKYDEDKLVRYTGNLLMLCSAVLISGGVASFMLPSDGETLGLAVWAVFTVFILAGLVYMNTGGRLMK